ncbi:MAG: hypothetical protein EAZ29_09880, partial [Runella slithyformis]
MFSYSDLNARCVFINVFCKPFRPFFCPKITPMKPYFLALSILLSCPTFAQKEVEFIDKPTENKIDVQVDGKPFTSY